MRWAAATDLTTIIRRLFPCDGDDQERIDRGRDEGSDGRDCWARRPSRFTEEELKRAKDDILNSFLFRYDTRDKVLAERVRLEFYGYPADYLETYKAALEKVTVSDLDRVAKKYIHPDKLAVSGGGQRAGDQAGAGCLEPGAGSSRGHHHSAAQTRAAEEKTQ